MNRNRLACFAGMVIWTLCRFGPTPKALTSSIVGFILILITWIDYDTMIIPNRLNLALLIPVILSIWSEPELGLLSRGAGFLAASLPMFVMNECLPGSFGGGDIKMMAACGMFLGLERTILAVFIGIVVGGLHGIVLLARKKLRRESQIAFGPYLSLGVWISLLYGYKIINWYAGFFL